MIPLTETAYLSLTKIGVPVEELVKHSVRLSQKGTIDPGEVTQIAINSAAGAVGGFAIGGAFDALFRRPYNESLTIPWTTLSGGVIAGIVTYILALRD